MTRIQRLRELLSTYNFFWGYGDQADEDAGLRAAREIRELGAQLMFRKPDRDAVLALWEEFQPSEEDISEKWPLRFGNVRRADDLPNEGVWFKKGPGAGAYCRIRPSAVRFYGLDESKVYGVDAQGGMTALEPDKWVVMCQRAVLDPKESLLDMARGIPRPRNDFDPFCGFHPSHYDDPDYTNPK